jgi:hypothetical protein
MANGIAFDALLREIPQAIEASAPSGTGGGRALSPEQRQKRQCALPQRGALRATCMQRRHQLGLCGIPGISDKARSVASEADPLLKGLVGEFG